MEANNLSDFAALVQQIGENWTPKDADWYLQPWFRGHGNASWPLLPGWYRPRLRARGTGSEYYSEDTLLETFKLRAPTYIERVPSTNWEWLFLMQHYGLPTRLLDWTESYLVALYFAVRDNPGDSDAAVWVMNPWWLNKETFGDYVLFPADDERAGSHSPLGPGQQLDAKLPLAITPIHASQRIAAQRGVFTIHGAEQGALDRLARRRRDKETCLQKIAIPSACIAAMRRELSIAGISESLVFPELSGLCREIRTDFFGA